MQKPIHVILKELRATSSSNDKRLILQRNDSPLLREVLYATYAPFQKYGLKKIPAYPRSDMSRPFEVAWIHIKNLLAMLATGHGDDFLKQQTVSVLKGLKPADAEVLECIIKKDLKAGITATTINKAFPGLIETFGIMKAATFKDELWKPNLMGSVKLDGYRCLVRDGRLLSSGGHLIQGADHILDALSGLGDFDGEIMVPGMEFNEGGGKIRSATVTPDAKLFVFDFIDNPDQPFHDRYRELEGIAKDQSWSTSLVKPATITLVRHRLFTGLEEMKQVYEKALYAGFEGLVLKDPDGVYELKRSKAWLKVKQVLDEDCPIIGFFGGDGKYVGMLGGVIVQRKNGYQSKVGGGFSDTLRYEIWHNQAKYLGKIIEVHYQNDTPDGDFRQARFKRFRPEKS